MGGGPVGMIAKVALAAGSMALTMSRKIDGPRLTDLKFTGGDYGAALERIWGIRRSSKPIFFAEDLKEVKRTRKTKGGKYNDYTYFGTWAVALAGYPISAVSRIWMDKHLVLDLTGAGPITPFDFPPRSAGKNSSTAGSGGFAINEYIAIYYGTETQEPDPRMQATIEAKFGEGSCPAYRGTPYLMLKDLPLEKFGNRIPQIDVEVVTNPTAIIPTEDHDNPILAGWSQAAFSPDYSRVLFMYDDQFEVWDCAARSWIISGDLGLASVKNYTNVGVYENGSFLFVGDLGDKLYQATADGASTVVLYDFDTFQSQDGVFVLKDGNGVEHWATYPDNVYSQFYFDGGPLDYGWQPTFFFVDYYGDVWAVGRTYATSTVVTFKRLVNCGNGVGWPDEITVSGLPSYSDRDLFATQVHTADGDHFVMQRRSPSGFYNYIVDPATGSVTSSYYVNTDASSTVIRSVWANIPPGYPSYWVHGTEISLLDGTTIRTAVSAATTDRFIYDPRNHALIRDLTGTMRWYFVDRVASTGVTLGTIFGDVADMVGVTDYDFSALDQIVRGWSATQGQASNWVEPLADAYDSDIRPHDFTLQGVKRSGVSTGTILTERFVGEPRYSIKVRQAAELPRAITVTFADIDADQQPNTARADRPLDATGAKGEQSIDMGTWASDADEAFNITGRYLRRRWNERREVANALTAQMLALEPADCITLDLDGESDTYRLTRLTVKASGELAAEFKYDHPALATFEGATGAPFDGREPSVVVVSVISRGFVLDTPLLNDADNASNPVVYTGAAPYADGPWAGATVYQAIDGDYSEEVASVPSGSRATWGYATGVLADANANVWDRGSSVNVLLQVGSLTGCTEAEVNTNPRKNQALLGDEVLNFTGAVLETDGSYTLSGLKRGRRGTEWAAGSHAVRDVFLLLDTVDAEQMGLSEVGTDLSFKAVTAGRTETSAFPIAVAPYTGASLKPYAPCHLQAVKDAGTGDWTLSWVRRTRVGGAWTSGTAIPLSEASEAYVVEIMNGGSVVRTITGLSSPTTVWTAANQTTDFGSGQTSVTFRVYQLSDAVGRGFVAVATV
jgi:hypothetical protein